MTDTLVTVLVAGLVGGIVGHVGGRLLAEYKTKTTGRHNAHLLFRGACLDCGDVTTYPLSAVPTNHLFARCACGGPIPHYARNRVKP